jgi:hypothetical protein
MDYFANLASAASALPAGQQCGRHAGAYAVTVCTRCGDYICFACRAPVSDGANYCCGCDEVANTGRYHAVPLWRFYVFSVLTFNVYPLYWAYTCWKRIKARDQSDIWPLPRGFFLALMGLPLVADVNTERASRKLPEISNLWPALYLIELVFSLSLARIASVPPLLDLARFLLVPALLLPVLRGMREVTPRGELVERARLRWRHLLVPIPLLFFVGTVLEVLYRAGPG